MATDSADADTVAEPAPTADVQAIVSRVTSLSIFFLGVGLFAVIGIGLSQSAVLSAYQLTYFAVGVAVGVVGLVLRLIAR